MQVPTVSSLFTAKLRAVGLPVGSDASFADAMDTAAAANNTAADAVSSDATAQGLAAAPSTLMYSLAPDVTYTLQPDDTAAEEDIQLSRAYAAGIANANGSSALGKALSIYARQFVGNPYVWGGEDPVKGADCSGFTQTIYQTFGMALPRTAYRQSQVGNEVSLKDLQSGDLLCFQNDDQTQVGHVGIYLGDGKFIHAANTKLGIIISDVSSWLTRLKTIRRLPELQQSAG